MEENYYQKINKNNTQICINNICQLKGGILMNDDEFLVYKVNDFKPLEKKEKISFKKGEKVVNMEEYKNIKNGNRNKVKRDNYWYPPIMSSHSGSVNSTYYPKGILDKVFPNKSPFKTNIELLMYLNDCLYNNYKQFEKNQARDLHNIQLAYNNKRLVNKIIRKIGKDPNINILNEIAKGVSSSANVTVYVVPDNNIEFATDENDKRIKYTYYIYDILKDGKLNPDFSRKEHALLLLNALMNNRLFLSVKQIQKSHNYKMFKQIMGKLYPDYEFVI